jgi:hypothetical protein
MHTVYVDDTGIDAEYPIVACAFCVSSINKWKKYEVEWRRVEREEGFRHFHMSEFAMCKPNYWCHDCWRGKKNVTHHPWREWTKQKRKRVLKRLARIVCEYSEFGHGLSLYKKDLDDLMTGEIRRVAGDEYHFRFAFMTCGADISRWRRKANLHKPMEYVFDQIPSVEHQNKIVSLFISAAERTDAVERYGMTPNGYSFKDKKSVIQLLGADMLAWASAQELFAAKGLRQLGYEAATIVGIVERSKTLSMSTSTREQLERWVRAETKLRDERR